MRRMPIKALLMMDKSSPLRKCVLVLCLASLPILHDPWLTSRSLAHLWLCHCPLQWWALLPFLLYRPSFWSRGGGSVQPSRKKAAQKSRQRASSKLAPAEPVVHASLRAATVAHPPRQNPCHMICHLPLMQALCISILRKTACASFLSFRRQSEVDYLPAEAKVDVG